MCHFVGIVKVEISVSLRWGSEGRSGGACHFVGIVKVRISVQLW